VDLYGGDGAKVIVSKNFIVTNSLNWRDKDLLSSEYLLLVWWRWSGHVENLIIPGLG